MAAAPPTTMPATRPIPPGDPFITQDAPPSDRPAMAPSELLRFGLTEGYLVVYTKLPPTPQQLQKMRGTLSPAYIRILSRVPTAAGAEYTPDLLDINFTHREGEQVMRTSLGTVVHQMNLSRDIVTGSAEQTIQFVQAAMASDEGTAARLVVQTMRGENVEKQEYVAEHFAAFIRRYPQQTTQYVRPMLEAFGVQPQLFAVGDDLACAVLPEAFQPDARTRDELLRLVNDLKDDDFRKRQQADTAIAAMGMRAMPVLATLESATLVPEQATRVAALLAKLRPPYDINPRHLREDRSFLLDCLLSENKAVREAAAVRLAEMVGKPLALPDAAPSVEAVYQLRRELLAQPSPATKPAKD